MNEDSQRRQIVKFLKGKMKKEVDPFCIYQWIECCHYYEWWDLGLKLATYIPPNSFKPDYHKRLDFFLNQCRGFYEDTVSEQNILGEMINSFLEESNLTLPEELVVRRNWGVLRPKDYALLTDLSFEDSERETLCCIFSMMLCMEKYECDFPNATKMLKRIFKYQTIRYRCTKKFAGTLGEFINWYQSGGILEKLNEKFSLSSRDYQKFADLLSKP